MNEPDTLLELKKQLAQANGRTVVFGNDFLHSVVADLIRLLHIVSEFENAVETLKNMPQFPNPMQIGFGDGRVLISIFTNTDANGLILHDTGVPHEVGIGAEQAEKKDYEPQIGDVFLNFKNAESVQVMIEELSEVKKRFISATT